MVRMELPIFPAQLHYMFRFFHNWKYLIPLIAQTHSLRWFFLFVTLLHFTYIDYFVEFSYTNIHWSYVVSGIHTIFLGIVDYFF